LTSVKQSTFPIFMNGPISIPYSRKNGMSAKKGHGRSNRIGTRLDLKGGASSPLDVDEGADNSDEWQQQAQRLLRNQDIIKRRQRSPESKCPYKPYKTAQHFLSLTIVKVLPDNNSRNKQ
jgi:hypothetical protein